MRTPSRTPDRALLRDAAAIAAAMIAVGASFGAIAIAYGLPTWVPFLMSTAVFAGGAQFLAVGLIAAGNPIAAVFAGLLLNARHLPFGLAVSATVGSRWRDRLIGSHLMTDEVVAFTLAEPDPVRRRRTYWLIGITLFTSWNTGTALGVWLGGATGDPATLGLDAAFPAGLIALILPSLRDRDTRLVALLGAAVAVALTPVLPAGLPVLCALLGLAAVFRPRRRTSHPPDTTGVRPPGPVKQEAETGVRSRGVVGQGVEEGVRSQGVVGQEVRNGVRPRGVVGQGVETGDGPP
ncbi:AzlC family ABC transporter permease, partial [Actinoplanes sp. NPDC048791]|uniref:AzlC family ABC transporter permease n=1 Tax=Actinoplanes sp. NPDC048791 TaxID=3154623 RepID=UPI0033C250C8